MSEISDELLLSIYSSGYASGVASTLLGLMMESGMPQEAAVGIATSMASGITGKHLDSPINRAEILEGMRAIVNGDDDGKRETSDWTVLR